MTTNTPLRTPPASIPQSREAKPSEPTPRSKGAVLRGAVRGMSFEQGSAFMAPRPPPPDGGGNGGARGGQVQLSSRKGATDWSTRKWTEMTPTQRLHWRVLGWDAYSWGTHEAPPSETKDWKDLDGREQEAAGGLGFTESTWNAAKPVSPLPDNQVDDQHLVTRNFKRYSQELDGKTSYELLTLYFDPKHASKKLVAKWKLQKRYHNACVEALLANPDASKMTEAQFQKWEQATQGGMAETVETMFTTAKKLQSARIFQQEWIDQDWLARVGGAMTRFFTDTRKLAAKDIDNLARARQRFQESKSMDDYKVVFREYHQFIDRYENYFERMQGKAETCVAVARTIRNTSAEIVAVMATGAVTGALAAAPQIARLGALSRTLVLAATTTAADTGIQAGKNAVLGIKPTKKGNFDPQGIIELVRSLIAKMQKMSKRPTSQPPPAATQRKASGGRAPVQAKGDPKQAAKAPATTPTVGSPAGQDLKQAGLGSSAGIQPGTSLSGEFEGTYVHPIRGEAAYWSAGGSGSLTLTMTDSGTWSCSVAATGLIEVGLGKPSGSKLSGRWEPSLAAIGDASEVGAAVKAMWASLTSAFGAKLPAQHKAEIEAGMSKLGFDKGMDASPKALYITSSSLLSFGAQGQVDSGKSSISAGFSGAEYTRNMTRGGVKSKSVEVNWNKSFALALGDFYGQKVQASLDLTTQNIVRDLNWDNNGDYYDVSIGIDFPLAAMARQRSGSKRFHETITKLEAELARVKQQASVHMRAHASGKLKQNAPASVIDNLLDQLTRAVNAEVQTKGLGITKQIEDRVRQYQADQAQQKSGDSLTASVGFKQYSTKIGPDNWKTMYSRWTLSFGASTGGGSAKGKKSKRSGGQNVATGNENIELGRGKLRVEGAASGTVVLAESMGTEQINYMKQRFMRDQVGGLTPIGGGKYQRTKAWMGFIKAQRTQIEALFHYMAKTPKEFDDYRAALELLVGTTDQTRFTEVKFTQILEAIELRFQKELGWRKDERMTRDAQAIEDKIRSMPAHVPATEADAIIKRYPVGERRDGLKTTATSLGLARAAKRIAECKS